MPTERKGPYFIERKEDLRVVRCAYPFHVVRTDEIESVQSGKDHATRPFVLVPGMKAMLKGDGLPDVEIDGGAA
ncbi:MAG TPA: hypothetical protein VHV10_15515 [Ktedonobacteraceae bacterium]|nr:hypothetical protein [Ktedonobacteraceae bacterium]